MAQVQSAGSMVGLCAPNFRYRSSALADGVLWMIHTPVVLECFIASVIAARRAAVVTAFIVTVGAWLSTVSPAMVLAISS